MGRNHSGSVIDQVAARNLSRRSLFAWGGGLVAAGALASCAVAPPTSGSTGTVRFAWWGSTERQRLIGQFASAFETKNAGSTIQLEPAEYSGYTDRLSVQAAGRNLPDVFWMPANTVTTYADSGSLYDLGELPEGAIDFSAFDPGVVDSWRLLDGKQLAPVYAEYSPATMIDQTAFSAAGITDFPDDETWNWDDLGQLAVDYARAAGDGNWGIANESAFYQHAHLWIRQQGAEVFTADGEIGFDEAALGSWFDWWQRWTDAGGVIPAQVTGGQNQWTQTAHQSGMYLIQLNQFVDSQAFSNGYEGGHELNLLKSPAAPGSGDDYHFKYYVRLCIAANAGDPELAASFINYLLNDLSAAEALGITSGVPSSPDIVSAIREVADPTATKVLDMQARIDERPARPRPEPPSGGSGWQSLVERASDDIFNGGVSIAEAVRNGIATLQSDLDRG